MRSLLAPVLLLLIACQAIAEEKTCADNVDQTYREFFCYGTTHSDRYTLSTSGTGCFKTGKCDVVFRMSRTQISKPPNETIYNIKYDLTTVRHRLDQSSETYDFYMTVSQEFNYPPVAGEHKERRASSSVDVVENTMIVRIITKGADIYATVQKVIIVIAGKEIEVPTGASSFWFDAPKRNENKTTYTFHSYNKLTYWKDGEKIYDVDIGVSLNKIHILVGDRAVIFSDQLFLFRNKPRGVATWLWPFEDYVVAELTGGDNEFEDGEKAKGSSILLFVLIVILLIAGVGMAVFSWHYYQNRQQATGFNLDGSEVHHEVAATAGEAFRHLNPTRRIGNFDLDDNEGPHEPAEMTAIRTIDPERRHSHGRAEGLVSVTQFTRPAAERFTARHSPRGSMERAHPPTPAAASRHESAEKVSVVSVHPISHRGSAERLPGTHSAPLVRSSSPVKVELAPRSSVPAGHGGGHRGSAEKIAGHFPAASQ